MESPDEPQTLTVEEAAKVLRIGRTAAYALAREWRSTNGASGLPVLELGRTLRVPRHALQLMLAGHPLPAVEAREAPPSRGHRPAGRRNTGPTQDALWSDREEEA
jgi:hypothetical protein